MTTDEMRIIWKRMDMVAKRKRAERRVEIASFLLACALIVAVALVMGWSH